MVYQIETNNAMDQWLGGLKNGEVRERRADELFDVFMSQRLIKEGCE
jgi:hypothetical protein